MDSVWERRAQAASAVSPLALVGGTTASWLAPRRRLARDTPRPERYPGLRIAPLARIGTSARPTPALPVELALEDASFDSSTFLLVLLAGVMFALYGWRRIGGSPRRGDESEHRYYRFLSIPILFPALVSFVWTPPGILASVRVDASGSWTLRSTRGDVLYEGPLQPGCSLTSREQSARLDMLRRRLVYARLRVADGLDWQTGALAPDDPALPQLRGLVDARCAVAPEAAPDDERPRPE
jgi:hypothetical protein